LYNRCINDEWLGYLVIEFIAKFEPDILAFPQVKYGPGQFDGPSSLLLHGVEQRFDEITGVNKEALQKREYDLRKEMGS
jgi:hypothetical protein